MKRVRCPKCDNYITFDETKYQEGQSLVFQCGECGKQFGIRMGVSKLRATQREANRQTEAEQLADATDGDTNYGSIVVIENVFHYKQVIPLRLGDNVIGRYQKGNPVNTPIETVDPSVDLNHCTLNVGRNRRGELVYTLSDGNSNTGTFVDNVELRPRERRVIGQGTLFTIGATSILLRSADDE